MTGFISVTDIACCVLVYFILPRFVGEDWNNTPKNLLKVGFTHSVLGCVCPPVKIASLQPGYAPINSKRIVPPSYGNFREADRITDKLKT